MYKTRSRVNPGRVAAWRGPHPATRAVRGSGVREKIVERHFRLDDAGMRIADDALGRHHREVDGTAGSNSSRHRVSVPLSASFVREISVFRSVPIPTAASAATTLRWVSECRFFRSWGPPLLEQAGILVKTKIPSSMYLNLPECRQSHRIPSEITPRENALDSRAGCRVSFTS